MTVLLRYFSNQAMREILRILGGMCSIPSLLGTRTLRTGLLASLLGAIGRYCTNPPPLPPMLRLTLHPPHRQTSRFRRPHVDSPPPSEAIVLCGKEGAGGACRGGSGLGTGFTGITGMAD